ncbi:FAD-binding protein [Zhongshania borealis]|uniref:FAD-binding protein n=1 Tax=Zhongshania borealis TaxID=889488 RepID=A0ABP7X1R6_9GAMM
MKDIQVDVLVVGSGNGGMTAALSSHILGAESVMIIEKDKCYGGTSAMSGGGVWVPCNRYAKAAGAADSLDEAFSYLRETIPREDTSDEMLRTYLKYAPEMIDFLHKNSDVRYESLAEYPDYFSSATGAKFGHRSMEPAPIRTSDLGEQFRYQNAPNPMIKVFDRLQFTQQELHLLMGQLPGWLTIVAREFIKYILDIPMRIKGKQSRRLTMGAAGIARLRLSLLKRDIPLHLNTKLLDLILKDGRVVGVRAERNGTPLIIRAKMGVILAAGGFEHNQDLRVEHLARPTNAQWSAGSRCNTGDSLLAAKRIGAATRLMNSAWWTNTVSVPGESYPRLSIFEKSLPGNYVIDSSGKRIANESQNYMSFIKELHSKHIDSNSNEPYHMIFDSTHRKNYIVGPLFPGKMWPDFLIPKSYFKNGFLSKENSLSALANTIGVDAKALAETVKQVNEYAEIGKDRDFGRGDSAYDRYYSDPTVKPNPCLAPLAKPPFYAMKLDAGDFGTMGGMVIDGQARVLTSSGDPIPGLYATGNCAMGILTTYPGPGSTLGPAMTFGYLAAKHLTGSA